jgi:prefoldin subunit 5
LLSQRKRASEKQVDVYQYDVLPEAFRTQVAHILLSTLGVYRDWPANSFLSEPTPNPRWKSLFSLFTRELGQFSLGDADLNPSLQCLKYLQSAKAEQALDFIDFAFQFINRDLREDSEYVVHIPGRGYRYAKLDEAIEELNQRLQQHHIGYQFQNGQLMKLTDQYLHEEVMLPALTLLTDPQFRGAQDEFLNAHRHYREGRYKEAVAEALKAFESTMKSILDERKWAYDKEKDTAQKLIKALFEHGLIPPMLESQFTSLRSLLETGLTTIRNRTSGHGQGTSPVPLPRYIAEYALHQAAANIVFLVQAYKEYKRDNG